MKPNRQHSFYYQAGFSLIEIMVGLAIGMLVSLVIMQVFSVFEGQKRTTTGTADAQTNGSVALYSIQRDLQMAGYGLLPAGLSGVADSPIECIPPLTIDAATGIGDISPVTITDGGVAGGSDSITIRYSTSDAGGIPSPITGVVGNDVNLSNNLACQTNDIALIMNGSACALTSVTGLSAANVTPATLTLSNPAGAVTGARIACLGTWREITYSVDSGNLMMNLTPGGASQAVISDIVNIQAQYGIGGSAAANPNRIVAWVNATGAWAPGTITITNRNRIKAIRIAVVARNGLLEKEDVTSACSSLTNNAPTGLCSWSATSAQPITASPAPAISLNDDPDGTSWKRYRYRVFETIVPLRNVVWAKSTL